MSIKVRLLLIFGFFLGVMLANVLAINIWISGAKDSAKVINVAGRQRMLSQRATKEVFLTVAGVDKMRDAKATMALFKSSLNGLINGSPSLGIPKPSSSEIISNLRKVDRLWGHYEQSISRVASSPTPELLTQIYNDSKSLLKETNNVVELLERDAEDRVGTLRVLVIVFLLITIGAALVGFWQLKSFLFSRIQAMKDESESMVQNKDFSKRIDVRYGDEVGATVTAFNEVIERFVTANSQTRDLEQELQKQLEMLSITTQENSNSMDIQRNEIIQVSTAVNQMASTVQEVARNTQEASTVATSAQEEANHGSALLDESLKLTHSLAQEVRGASENIEKLAMASDSIGGIADTISTIAEQTNLLALNAAIEAARAGEQGRGFAVVADEVRTLAQRTQEATSEIHKLITTLQETTQASVETMENSKKASEQGVAQAENMSAALTKIIDSVQNLSNINHQIAVAAEEQTSVADEINENIVKIESKAENTYSNAQASAQYTQNLSQMASELRERLLEYKIN